MSKVKCGMSGKKVIIRRQNTHINLKWVLEQKANKESIMEWNCNAPKISKCYLFKDVHMARDVSSIQATKKTYNL